MLSSRCSLAAARPPAELLWPTTAPSPSPHRQPQPHTYSKRNEEIRTDIGEIAAENPIMAFSAGLGDRADDLRFRNAQSPRDESSFPSITSPLRGVGREMQAHNA